MDNITPGVPLAEWMKVGLAIFGVAQMIARLTPTPKDDEIVSKIGRFFNILFSATRNK